MELLVVGGLFFWLVIILEIILLFVFISYENGIGAAISLILFGLFLQYYGQVNLVEYVQSYPIYFFGCLLAYFLIGTVWAIIKWYLYCKDQLFAYEEMKQEFLRSRGITNAKLVPDHLKEDWKRRVGETRVYTEFGSASKTIADVPMVSHNKARILHWMTFWVVSMIWTFLHELLGGLFVRIYRGLASFLQKISDDVWHHSNVKQDLEN